MFLHLFSALTRGERKIAALIWHKDSQISGVYCQLLKCAIITPNFFFFLNLMFNYLKSNFVLGVVIKKKKKSFKNLCFFSLYYFTYCNNAVYKVFVNLNVLMCVNFMITEYSSTVNLLKLMLEHNLYKVFPSVFYLQTCILNKI